MQANEDCTSGSYNGVNLEAVSSYLTTERFGHVAGWANELWDTLDSTNNRAIELARAGAPEGLMVLARQQTAGRGRQGRSWVSPADSGIYVSFLLRPQGPLSSLPLYTLASGVACVKAIRDCIGVTIGLKWVNDLIYENKKVGGILAEIPGNGELSQSGSPGSAAARALIVGIGINVRLDEVNIPLELKDRIDWLERLSGQMINSNFLIATLALHLERMWDLVGKQNHAEIIRQWKEHTVTLGKQVRAQTGNRTIEGVAVDIAGDGALIIETTEGKREILPAGEISVRGPAGSYI